VTSVPHSGHLPSRTSPRRLYPHETHKTSTAIEPSLFIVGESGSVTIGASAGGALAILMNVVGGVQVAARSEGTSDDAQSGGGAFRLACDAADANSRRHRLSTIRKRITEASAGITRVNMR
jgi:hypothetical protein